MKKVVRVICPICKKNGIIEISEDSIKNFDRGILAVNVQKISCKHSFIVYLDKNYIIRDYFYADFHLELPETVLKTKMEIDQEKNLLEDKPLDVDLIKLNFSPILLTYTLKAIFLGEKFILILDDPVKFIHEYLINFYNYITQTSFKLELEIISDNEYNENSKIFKNYLVFDKKGVIINDNRKILNSKDVAVERRIIQKFLAESDPKSSLILLKNEIQVAFELSKFISGHFEKIEWSTKIDITDVYKGLQEQFNVKISAIYLSFLFEIVENYFKIEIPGSLKRILKIIF